jgi:hypothetical protein
VVGGDEDAHAAAADEDANGLEDHVHSHMCSHAQDYKTSSLVARFLAIVRAKWQRCSSPLLM